MALHRNLNSNDIHVINSYTYSNASDRLSATGFLSTDIGKVAKQEDNNSFWILKDTAPTWYEITNTMAPEIFGRITVGLDGPVNFNTIKEGIAQAILNGASNSNPWSVIVYPGTYIEDNPLIIPAGVIVTTLVTQRVSTTFVRPANPLDDLFTITGGSLIGFNLLGVTDSLKGLIRVGTPGQVSTINACSITNCSNGIIVDNGANAVVNFFSAVVASPNSSIDTCIYVNGSDSNLFFVNGQFVSPEQILPFYTKNPIKTGIHIDNGATANILGGVFQIAEYDSNQISVLLDGYQSNCRILGCNFIDGYTAIKISPSGDETFVVANASIFNHSINLSIQSSTGAIFETISTDVITRDIVPGASISGIISAISDDSVNLTGNVNYIWGASASRKTNIASLIFDRTSSGLSSGGDVIDTGGLFAHVAAGSGWIRRQDEIDSIFASWNESILELFPNSTNYIFLEGSSLQLEVDTSVPSPSDILLAQVFTNNSEIRFIHNVSNTVANNDYIFHRYLLTTRKFALDFGLAVSEGSSPTKINIDVGAYYIALTHIVFSGDLDAIFSYFYDNGNVEIPLQNNIDITNFDNSGTLTEMSDGYYRTDTVYLTSDDRISIIYGTEQFDNGIDASSSSPELPPPFIEPTGVSLAKIIVQKNVGLTSIIDLRPNSTATSEFDDASTITSHHLLSGLLNDDHPQYLLVNGTRAMSGNLNMNTNNIINVNLVDGVDISSHASRHNPGQVDALSTAAPLTILVGATISEGSASSFARSDHQHGIISGTPLTISTANNPGVASTVSRSDHEHAHGSLIGGSTHALATPDPGGSAGFMSPSDKQKLDSIEANATNSPLSNTIPSNVNKSAASAGVASESSRRDHKHNIDTATAGTINVGDASSEGTSTSLSRADHVHALTAPAAPVNVNASTASAGVATTVARSDHKHNVDTGIPVSIGTSNSAGSATSLALSDHVHRGNVLQIVFLDLSSNTTTNSTSFVDLLNQAVTTTGGNLVINFSVSGSATSNNRVLNFTLLIDDVLVRGAEMNPQNANSNHSTSIIYKATGLSAGAHTVKIQWKTSGGTAQILPVTNLDSDHASLLITETTL